MPDVKTLFWLFGLIFLAPACAGAQVLVNSAALRQLQGLPPVAAPPIQQVIVRPPAPKPDRPHAHARPHPHPRPYLMQPPPPAPAPPIKPGKPAPTPTPAVTPHVPVLPPTVRIAFAPSSARLPANAVAMLQPFCATKSRIPILARAPAMPDNPGEAMQLSMQRAFAIRAALISCGVPAQNIIPQSTGGISGADSNVALIGAHTTP